MNLLDTFAVAILLRCRMMDVWRLVEAGLLQYAIVVGVYRFRESDIRAYQEWQRASRKATSL